MSNEIIWEIISSKIKGEYISEQDEQLFRQWIEASVENANIYHSIENFFSSENMRHSIDVDEAYRNVIRRMEIVSDKKKKVERKVKLWRISVAAAIFVGILLTIGLVVFNTNQDTFFAENIESGSRDSINVVLGLHNGKNIIINRDKFMNIANNSLVASNHNGVLNCVSGDGDENYNTISTPTGKDYKIVLNDGTEIWLNSQTTLAFPSVFDSRERRVKLIGEAFFKVAKNSKWPFIVETQHICISVTGTSFDVKSYQGDANELATLVEGSVKIASKLRPHDNVDLLPNEQYSIDLASGKQLIREVDADIYTAWMNKMFVYKNLQLSDVMKDISRWYNIKYRFFDTYSASMRISANVEKGRGIDNIMQIIGKLNNINVKHINNEYIIESICK